MHRLRESSSLDWLGSLLPFTITEGIIEHIIKFEQKIQSPTITYVKSNLLVAGHLLFTTHRLVSDSLC